MGEDGPHCPGKPGDPGRSGTRRAGGAPLCRAPAHRSRRDRDRGAKPKYTVETGRRILAVLDGPPPDGFARWTGPLIAKALGDVDVQYIWPFLRA
jgi:hypothetical protein